MTAAVTCPRCQGRVLPDELGYPFCVVCGWQDYSPRDFDEAEVRHDRKAESILLRDTRNGIVAPAPTYTKPEPEHPETPRIEELQGELGPLLDRVKVLRSELRRLKSKVYQREYRANNAERLRKWRRDNPNYQKEWLNAHPGYTTQKARNERRVKRQAETRERERSLSECEVCHGLGQVKCLVCGSA